MILFLDFEASSLTQDSFPVEVAWVDEAGRGETHLIRPTGAWMRAVRAGTGWSGQSEAVHGIALDTLLREGEPAEDVARRTLEVLGAPNARPVADQPNYDGAWLRDLLDAADLGPVPRLGELEGVLVECLLPLANLLPPIGDPRRGAAVEKLRGTASRTMAECAVDEERTRRERHRALADARSHWRTWRAVKDRADALLAARRRDGSRTDGPS